MKHEPLPSPDSPLAPKYWRYETGGQLVPAVEKYLRGEALSVREVRWIAAYLRQWIASPVWGADGIARLRTSVERIQSRSDITNWLDAALALGIDPL
jgi:hypothetical protein